VLRDALSNTGEQLARFASGDGLEPWADQVTPWLTRDFPPAEQSAYLGARQQAGALSVPSWLGALHQIVALGGIAACLFWLPFARRRCPVWTGLMLTALLTLPLSAAITGTLSFPHDRYQSRVAWLPACAVLVGLGARGSRSL
jgi:hypothetical protein